MQNILMGVIEWLYRQLKQGEMLELKVCEALALCLIKQGIRQRFHLNIPKLHWFLFQLIS